jgi:hypothetical protein
LLDSAFRIPNSAFETLIFRPFFKDSRRLPKEFPRICKGARKSAKDSPRILKDSKDFARHTARGVQRASFCSAPWATQLLNARQPAAAFFVLLTADFFACRANCELGWTAATFGKTEESHAKPQRRKGRRKGLQEGVETGGWKQRPGSTVELPRKTLCVFASLRETFFFVQVELVAARGRAGCFVCFVVDQKCALARTTSALRIPQLFLSIRSSGRAIHEKRDRFAIFRMSIFQKM